VNVEGNIINEDMTKFWGAKMMVGCLAMNSYYARVQPLVNAQIALYTNCLFRDDSQNVLNFFNLDQADKGDGLSTAQRAQRAKGGLANKTQIFLMGELVKAAGAVIDRGQKFPSLSFFLSFFLQKQQKGNCPIFGMLSPKPRFFGQIHMYKRQTCCYEPQRNAI
jgi:hypothetical protein